MADPLSTHIPSSSGDTLTAKERRFTQRLLYYWDEIRADRLMPSEYDIDPEAIAEIWDHCFLLQE